MKLTFGRWNQKNRSQASDDVSSFIHGASGDYQGPLHRVAVWLTGSPRATLYSFTNSLTRNDNQPIDYLI